jgi:hypothetical protein
MDDWHPKPQIAMLAAQSERELQSLAQRAVERTGSWLTKCASEKEIHLTEMAAPREQYANIDEPQSAQMIPCHPN